MSIFPDLDYDFNHLKNRRSFNNLFEFVESIVLNKIIKFTITKLIRQKIL